MFLVVLALAFFSEISTAAASFIIALGVIILAWNFFRTRELPNFESEILKVLAIYFAAQILIASFSINQAISFRDVFAEFYRFFPLIFAMTSVKNKNQLRLILIAVLIVGILDCLTGIFQCLVLGKPRASGFNNSPTFFASAMLIHLPVQIFILSSEFMPKIWRRTAGAAIILSLIGLILSMTRGAWLAIILVTIIFFMLERKHRTRTVKIFAVIVSVSAILLMNSVVLQARISTLTNLKFQSNAERILMWQASEKIIRDYPLLGAGQKTFAELYNGSYFPPEAKERGHTQPHNNFLNEACEGGAVGAIVFVGFYAYFFRRFYLQHKQERDMKFSAGMTVILILAGLHLEGLTDTNLIQVPLMREFWIIAGTLSAAHRILYDSENKNLR